ncbi:DNA-3-methyladenine glycosylase family protein [Arthrobacter caoxuetaonis]|uniref:DNA-3-methyladenine glycosylase II n=1 Tax=Arthrobacter caoxuetaonis TaxID=2886935 RepID=A0A9X1SC02_9MICC|nr:AlkA N-terminal domain-containing protein [Arthrobacter caoxuetaonis]MCC3298225.1 3-methyladenine DNA glycosylase 2 [Arthrobacter caoxuetaonis]USQ57226.1 3-methyladenine DNA glycosylase 2 [Arthrobacter caoxuetaonis]
MSPAEAGEPDRMYVLAAAGPFPWQPLVRSLAAHAVPGLETVEVTPSGAVLTRLWPAPGGPVLAQIGIGAPDGVSVSLNGGRQENDAGCLGAVRSWLDLDADTHAVDTALAGFPRLAPLVERYPGLRIPGSVDGFETAVLTVLGQQVSLAAARTFAARLVAAYGTAGPGGLRTFPAPGELAAVAPADLQAAVRITGARAGSIHALAEAAAGGLELGRHSDWQAVRPALLALPGIGPWTADYLEVRAAGDRDAFIPGDLVLRRALGVATAKEASRLAEDWRPWRAYALFHLWTEAAYDIVPAPA